MYEPSLLDSGVTIPFDFGLPQFIILLIGLGGLALLIHVVLRMARGKKDKTGARHRHFHWGRAISGVVLLFVSIALIYLAILLQTYFGLTSKIKVATVHAIAIANEQHQMSVDIRLYDQHGNQTSENTYLICGDEWELTGDIVKLADWTGILGLHTGYKLTRLQGYYNDIQLARGPQCAQALNGGDDNFFKTLQNQGGWLHPLVQAAYGNAIILPADGNTYDIFVSQTGLTTDGPVSFRSASSALEVISTAELSNTPRDCRQLH